MARSNLSAHSPQKTKQKLTKEELLVLQSHLEEWKEAIGKNRQVILHAVIREAKMQAPKMDSRLLKKRKSMYQDWLYNRRAEKTLKKESKFGKKWTAWLVIERQYKKEIIEKTGGRLGGKEMIKNYQGAVNAIMGGLSEEQLEEAKKTAIEWSSKAPPMDVQAEFAQKKALGMMKDLATQLWRQAGIRIFILSAWKTEEGEVRINGMDFNEQLEGNSFTNTKDWKPMLSEWNAYVREEFVVDQNDEDDNEDRRGKDSGKQRRKKEEFALEVDTCGLPVIPDIEDLSLEKKKSLICTFLTRHYRFCSQKPKVSVPWSAVTEAQDDFIESKFLPAGVKIKDPSKLQLHEADKLLELWHQRQKDEVPSTFEFKGWQNHNKEMREPVKRTSRQVEQDFSSEGEDSDEGAGDGTRSGLATAKTKAPVKMPTGRMEPESRKLTRCVEQESSSEGEDSDEGAGDGTKSGLATAKTKVPVKTPTGRMELESRKLTRWVEQESNNEGKDSDEGAGYGTRSGLTTAKTSVPVEKPTGKPTRKTTKRMEHQSSRGRNVGDEEVQLLPSKSKSIGRQNQAVQSDSEQEDAVPVRKMRRKEPTPKSTAPSTTQATHKTRKTTKAQIDNPEPKSSARTTKVSYKVNYMQRQ
ncbi:uncharacterized protein EDB93DRAFT_1251984 [Suillus bovinus]|uniref:uncharacterized protein n=1 Tax=Suillus bovinus TaxID=48563 RepID=UPI001B85BA1F|nr:uncharacterized protein EDB93DRAFT_1251984 [Suillus bovinus]KAG2143571.1 hypothetical protein EDB93DRAFT_1251984 [Suillus bovinus]